MLTVVVPFTKPEPPQLQWSDLNQGHLYEIIDTGERIIKVDEGRIVHIDDGFILYDSDYNKEFRFRELDAEIVIKGYK